MLNIFPQNPPEVLFTSRFEMVATKNHLHITKSKQNYTDFFSFQIRKDINILIVSFSSDTFERGGTLKKKKYK